MSADKDETQDDKKQEEEENAVTEEQKVQDEEEKAWLEEMAQLEELLAASFPAATRSECKRFLYARDGSLEGATQQLQSYLEWLELHELNKEEEETPVDDEEIWKRAAKKATAYDCEEAVELPRVVRTYTTVDDNKEATACDGTVMIQTLPAQIDISIAPAETYALAMAFYVYYKTDRHSLTKCTVLLDVRAGTGWPNEPAYSLLGFVKTVANLLNSNFPERLQKMLLFPVPTLGVYAWEAAKLFLDEDTTEKIVVIGGPAKEDSPAPQDDMVQHMDVNVLQMMEDGRKRAFLEPKESTGWLG